MADLVPDDDVRSRLVAGAEEGIGTLLMRLIDDGKQFVRAEIALLRARLLVRLDDAKTGLILIAIALLLVMGAAIGLVVGLLLILAAALGPIWATIIVVGGSLAFAVLLGWLAVAKLQGTTPDEETLP